MDIHITDTNNRHAPGQPCKRAHLHCGLDFFTQAIKNAMWFGLMRKKKTEGKETKNPQRFSGKAYKINKGKSEELFWKSELKVFAQGESLSVCHSKESKNIALDIQSPSIQLNLSQA